MIQPVLIGDSDRIRAIEQEIEYAALSDAKVLITGPSGVGKEVVARLIHQKCRRSQRALVTINCAGVPDSLLESELFGHVRGSFTDAYRDKRGWLEHADGGTIFLDEVGEMSLRMQALLLRFLETGEIQRVGSDRTPTIVDVRVIAATNRSLLDRIAVGEFREDLYYRLNVIHLEIPPLRDRREDVAVLFAHFLKIYSDVHRTTTPEITPEALCLLQSYDWPGNVREVKNVAERLVVRFRSKLITPLDLPAEILSPSSSADAGFRSQTGPAAPSMAVVLYDQIVNDGGSFWSRVYEPFMSRDLTREDVRAVVAKGLQVTRGSYKELIPLFNMDAEDYKRFLNFLRKYECHLPFQRFRGFTPHSLGEGTRRNLSAAMTKPRPYT